MKVLNLQQPGASKIFVTKCEALRNARHRNLLRVITACSSVDYQGNDFEALVYEYVYSGSLESNNCIAMREIMIGVSASFKE